MDEGIIEKRRFERVYFKAEDGLRGIFSLPNNHEDILIANVMNLSKDGIGLVINKTEYISISPGDRLILNEVKGGSHLAFMRNIETEIKWILNHRSLEHIGLGCQLLNTSKEIRQNIGSYINSYIISNSL